MLLEFIMISLLSVIRQRYITKGKRSGNAYSASVEYGQKIPLNPNWYVDPQIPGDIRTYPRVELFTTKKRVKVNTDRVNSLIRPCRRWGWL